MKLRALALAAAATLSLPSYALGPIPTWIVAGPGDEVANENSLIYFRNNGENLGLVAIGTDDDGPVMIGIGNGGDADLVGIGNGGDADLVGIGNSGDAFSPSAGGCRGGIGVVHGGDSGASIGTGGGRGRRAGREAGAEEG